MRVLKGQRTACFIETHGERNLDSTDRDGYDHFKNDLGDENYTTETLPFLQKIGYSPGLHHGGDRRAAK